MEYITLFTNNIDEYLREDSVIDYGDEIITKLADALYRIMGQLSRQKI